MTTIQEVEQNINSIKEELSKLEEKLKTLKSGEGRRMFKKGDTYYYINMWGTVTRDIWDDSLYDTKMYSLYKNCFVTVEEAQKEVDRRLVKAKLNEIANRLNNDQVIDWDTDDQIKYSLSLQLGEGLFLDATRAIKIEGATYCLSEDFLEVAADEIGEQELIDYMKNN